MQVITFVGFVQKPVWLGLAGSTGHVAPSLQPNIGHLRLYFLVGLRNSTHDGAE